MKTRIPKNCAPVNAQSVFDTVVEDAREELRRAIGARLTALLVAVANHAVGRDHYVRRRHVPPSHSQEAVCQRCHSQRSQRFSRNGFRDRQPLMTMWGEVPLALPRVRCQCGGSVELDFGGLLQAYQRVGKDVDAQIQRWGNMAISLRQMCQELMHLHLPPLSLKTVMERLHQVSIDNPEQEVEEVPPIIQVDAVWATLLRSNGQVRRDRKGRNRPVKGRFKVPIMIAMGVWPDSGRREILLWRVGESESADEWVKFLEILEAQGISGGNGLELIIHDGGPGLCSALETVWFDAKQQRCLFHKLRNIYHAIRVSDELSDKQRRRQRRKIFNDFRQIWEARRPDTMLRRYLRVVRAYRYSQPKAVATLRRDFRLTVTYYELEKEFPSWERKHLRTTSRLERFNRPIRRRLRAANAYHSDAGLSAMMAQEIIKFHDTQQAR